MKTEIFCIVYAVLCLSQSCMALRCYTCNNCNQGHDETTCADGEVCGKVTVFGNAGDTLLLEYDFKACVPADTTCEQQQQIPYMKSFLERTQVMINRRGGILDIKCELCSDKDYCN